MRPPREPHVWSKGIEIYQLVPYYFPFLENLGFYKKIQSGLLTLYKGFIYLDQRTVITICVFQGSAQGSFFCAARRMGEPRGSWRQKQGRGLRKDSSTEGRVKRYKVSLWEMCSKDIDNF